MKSSKAIQKNIGKQIKAFRKQAGYKTQKDFAEALGWNPSFISLIESGKQNLTISTLTDILNILHISFSDFFDLVDSAYPNEQGGTQWINYLT